MSKAFTRESDGAPDPSPRLSQPAGLPAGAKNYLTPGGADRLREELERLAQSERPRLAAQIDQPNGRHELALLDARIRYLQQSLRTAVIVPPPATMDGRVRFGATVTIRQSDGEMVRYRIVGVDEMDVERGWVSWLSPIAKALMNTAVGDRVRFRNPAGEETLEILSVQFEGFPASSTS